MSDRGVLCIVGLLLVSAAAGCLGTGESKKDSESPTGSTSPSPTNATENQTVTVMLLNYTETVAPGDPINVTWEVKALPDPDEPPLVNHTNVHYGGANVSEPLGESAYGNATEAQNGTIADTFNASFTPEGNGTIYLRAHAIVGDMEGWSEEVQVTLGGNATRTVHIVEIRGAGPLAAYEPENITIKAGDAVKWKNMDTLNQAHTATSDSDAPTPFTTGDIAGAKESNPVNFTAPGTWGYHCNRHPLTMTGAEVYVT